MVATVSGVPNTSNSTRFGLNGTMLLESLGVAVTLSEANMPCRRYTANAATASTTTATRIIHRCPTRRAIENRCIRDLSMSGRQARTVDDVCGTAYQLD